MAFVEVVRRSMRPEEWTDLRFSWIKRGLIEKQFAITDLQIKDARQVSEDRYEMLSDWRPFQPGDIYFTPDGSVFIRGTAEIPEELLGEKIWFHLHTAAEMIVKINGTYAGGIDPNRDRLLVNPFLEAGSRKITIEIEGYNRSKPDDERNPDAMDSRGCRQIFEGAYLAKVNEPLLSLFYDLTILLDIAKSAHFDEDYRAFLNRELDRALNLVDFDTWEGVEAAAKYIEEHIYQNTDFRSSGNVALVGHSHLDIAYYWRRIHVVHKNARTILIQMRLMDQYPDFKYCHTQPYTYETLEKYYPELFAELKEKVRSGQFEPVGAMYVEPDCNIPSAESLVRQCLYGQHYYRKAFGITVDNAWLPDVFGNSWILPQILKKSGVNYFVSNKMSTWNDTNRFPHNNFLWKGIDGTKVYACVPPTHFITWNMPSQIQENWDAYQDKEVGGQTLSMFGYGDGGSGATEEMVELMHRFDKLSIMPKTEHMRAEEFLHRNLNGNENLETWDGELYLEMHRGTFTTKALLKDYNRRLEWKLRTAELLAVLSIKEGRAYPQEELRDCYKKLLLNQFHDILPGSHINPVFEDAKRDYEELEARLDALIDSYRTPDSHWFNPLNVDRKEVAFAADERGAIVRKGVRGTFAYPKIASLDLGEVAPTFGTDTSWITVNNGEKLTAKTPYYEIRFAQDGAIESLYDLRERREWTDGGFNKLHLYQDTPGVYDAWDILPNYKDVEYDLRVEQPLTLTFADENVAEFYAVLRTSGDKSRWEMRVRVFAASPYIEVEHIVDWNEKHRLMKAEFSCNVLSRELVCDTSAGYIRRETHRNTSWQKARFEVCHHRWCDFAEEGGGIALINENKYGLGVEEKGFSLSLLRSNIRPDIMSDIGHHDFCYVILPHAGNGVEAKINEKALEYNVPLVRANVSAPNWDFGSLHLQAVKLSEDGEYVVFRLCEQNGRRGRILLPWNAVAMNLLEDIEGEICGELEYQPFEIVTFGVKKAEFTSKEITAD